MKYATAVTGLAAAVAVIAAFRLDYSILVIGSLFTLGLMYVILSFSRWSSRPAKTSALLNIGLAWTFSILIVGVATFLTTAICFGWPPALQELLRSGLLPRRIYWKLKVFDFADYGERAERNRIGKRFASAVLDELGRSQLRVLETTGTDPVSIIPQRGQSDDSVHLKAYTEIAPAVIVSGYVSDADASGTMYVFTIRVTVASPDRLTPLWYGDGYLADTPESLHHNASQVAAQVSALAEMYSKRH